MLWQKSKKKGTRKKDPGIVGVSRLRGMEIRWTEKLKSGTLGKEAKVRWEGGFNRKKTAKPGNKVGGPFIHKITTKKGNHVNADVPVLARKEPMEYREGKKGALQTPGCGQMHYEGTRGQKSD